MFQDSPQIADTVCLLGIRETARSEHARNLPIEFGAVGDDHNGRLLLGSVTPELECKPQHRQALARTLCVPNDTAALARLPSRTNPAHRLVHGDELLIACQFANAPAAFDLEHDEVPHDVEQIARLE